MKFKDLGLLIVDEEQRFGVTHKEKIKQLQKNVDVLTLTATPIPRTMHMSLIGIRDMSVLEEAPQDRQPIQTFVCEYNEEMVREAINRELARGGQVYYVYNRVQSIADMANTIQKLVPGNAQGYVAARQHGKDRCRDCRRLPFPQSVKLRHVFPQADGHVAAEIPRRICVIICLYGKRRIHTEYFHIRHTL